MKRGFEEEEEEEQQERKRALNVVPASDADADAFLMPEMRAEIGARMMMLDRWRMAQTHRATFTEAAKTQMLVTALEDDILFPWLDAMDPADAPYLSYESYPLEQPSDSMFTLVRIVSKLNREFRAFVQDAYKDRDPTLIPEKETFHAYLNTRSVDQLKNLYYNQFIVTMAGEYTKFGAAWIRAVKNGPFADGHARLLDKLRDVVQGPNSQQQQHLIAEGSKAFVINLGLEIFGYSPDGRTGRYYYLCAVFPKDANGKPGDKAHIHMIRDLNPRTGFRIHRAISKDEIAAAEAVTAQTRIYFDEQENMGMGIPAIHAVLLAFFKTLLLSTDTMLEVRGRYQVLRRLGIDTGEFKTFKNTVLLEKDASIVDIGVGLNTRFTYRRRSIAKKK